MNPYFVLCVCVYTVTILSQKWLLNKLGSQIYGLDETHFNFNVSAYNNHLGTQVVLFYQTEVVTIRSVSDKKKLAQQLNTYLYHL